MKFIKSFVVLLMITGTFGGLKLFGQTETKNDPPKYCVMRFEASVTRPNSKEIRGRFFTPVYLIKGEDCPALQAAGEDEEATEYITYNMDLDTPELARRIKKQKEMDVNRVKGTKLVIEFAAWTQKVTLPSRWQFSQHFKLIVSKNTDDSLLWDMEMDDQIPYLTENVTCLKFTPSGLPSLKSYNSDSCKTWIKQ